jgi:dihydroneopterin aldolase
LADQLVAIVTGPPVDLIETLADRMVAACLADPRVRTATVTVHKPQAPIAHEFADVAVTLTRDRS